MQRWPLAMDMGLWAWMLLVGVFWLLVIIAVIALIVWAVGSADSKSLFL